MKFNKTYRTSVVIDCAFRGYEIVFVKKFWVLIRIHYSELIGLRPPNTVFQLRQATVPKEYETLERAIEITNDLSRDMDLGEPVVTKAGIMGDDETQCQALLNRITVEIDMTLDMLSYQKGVKMPGRNIQNPDYNRIFDETARRTYEVITGRKCPESVRVI